MTKAGPPGDTQALPTGTWDSMSAWHVCQSFGCGRRSPSRSCCCLSVPPRDRGPLPSQACEPTGHSPPTGAPPHRGTGSVEEDEIPITQVPCAGVSGGCPALLAAVCRSSLLGRVTSGSGRCSMTAPPPEGRFPGPGPSHGTWHLRILGAGQLWHGLRPLWVFEQAAKDRPAVSHGPPRSQKAAQRLSRRRAGTEAGPGRPSPPMLSELGFETSGLGRHRAQRVQPPLRAPCRRGHQLP